MIINILVKFIYSITFISILCLGCQNKSVPQENGASEGEELPVEDPCTVDPDPGPCRGAITRYYFDREKQKCLSFIYGGCEGTVPFITLEECEKACGKGSQG